MVFTIHMRTCLDAVQIVNPQNVTHKNNTISARQIEISNAIVVHVIDMCEFCD